MEVGGVGEVGGEVSHFVRGVEQGVQFIEKFEDFSSVEANCVCNVGLNGIFKLL